MQAAKEAVKKFTSKDGHHDTTVHEKVAPAVTNETVTRQQEDRVHTAIDKEVHQDHYHTSVQPVHDREVLPEQHHHKTHGVEHRHFEHDDHSRNKDRLASEAAQFKDQTTRVEGSHSQTAQPVVAGEHKHHHVHETIQPVVHKQTVEPHVVHNTVPVHEVHHNAAQHHSASALPAVSMDEFKSQGGVLGGRAERSDAFTGEPKHVGGGLNGGAGLSNTGSTGTTGTHTTGTHTTGTHTTGAHTTGTHPSGTHSGTTGGLTGTSSNNSAQRGLDSKTTSAATGATGVGATGAGVGSTAGRSGSDGTQKASLMDKLNPSKDADGDGKKGFMS